MKRKNIIFVTLLLLSGLFAMQSCQKADNTTFTTRHAFTTPVCSTTPAVRADGTILFSGTADQVELSWVSTSKDGDPVSWNVYFGNGKSPQLISSGLTTNKINVTVFDGLTYYWRVEIIDSKGVVTTSAMNTFIAVNGTSQKLKMNLETSTDVKTAIGMDLAAGDVIDNILNVVCPANPANNRSVDATSADEEFSDWHNMPDGDYEIWVDVYGAYNFGSYNEPISISYKLKFFQLGFIDETMEFPGVTDNWSFFNAPADGILPTRLVKINKTGAVYTITRDVYNDTKLLEGSYGGYDGRVAYPSHVVCRRSGSTMVLDSIGIVWMANYWGEEITASTPTKIYLDWSANTVYIPKQTYCTTRYLDSSVPPKYVYTNYDIYGTGTFDMSGPKPVMHIRWKLYVGTTLNATNLPLEITMN